MPPLLNKSLDIRSNEVFVIVIFAALFFIAGFSETIHVAEAIGALLLGLVFSETAHSDRIEHLVVPFRDFFGAMFSSASVSALIRFHSEMRYGSPSAPFC